PLGQGGNDLPAAVHQAVHRGGGTRGGNTAHGSGRCVYPLDFGKASALVLAVTIANGGGQGHAFPGQGGNLQFRAVDHRIPGVVHIGGALWTKAQVVDRVDDPLYVGTLVAEDGQV